MKVEPGLTHNVVRQQKPVSADANSAKKSVKSNKSDRLNTEEVRNRIVQWFAKAGIQHNVHFGIEQDPNKRVARHQKLRAQMKLQNLEKIMGLSMEFSLENGIHENLDPDWFFSFIDLAEQIYSPAMQELWGKIFAVEVSRPGTFSLRSLQTLKRLTQKDAQIFKTAVKLACRKKGEHNPKLIFGYHQKPNVLSILGIQKDHHLNLAEFGLAYPDLLSLMELGLIYNSEIESGELNPNSRNEWRCGKEVFNLAPRRRGLTLNYYKFTATGAELFRLVSGHPDIEYLSALKNTLSTGFELD